MAADSPRWTAGKPGPKAPSRGQKGDKGDPGMLPGTRRAFLIVTVIIIALALAGLLLGERAYGKVTALARAECQSNQHLGTVPIPVRVPAGQAAPSRFGIRFVVDARLAWHLAGCPGRLGAPSPGLLHWARVYRIPVALAELQ